jgi:hypothetical protein
MRLTSLLNFELIPKNRVGGVYETQQLDNVASFMKYWVSCFNPTYGIGLFLLLIV